MLYLTNTTKPQVLFVPKDGEVPEGTLTFEAVSTVDLDTAVSQEVIDLDTSGLYFNVSIALPEGVQDGEYEYTLSADGIPVSSGLLVIGENFHPSQYEKSITYEQYESE